MQEVQACNGFKLCSWRVQELQILQMRPHARCLVKNWRDFGDVVVSSSVKRVREPRPFDLPATWEHEVPGEGLLQLHYYTSEKWVDRDLQSMLCALLGRQRGE
jgi:hypothetical protein